MLQVDNSSLVLAAESLAGGSAGVGGGGEFIGVNGTGAFIQTGGTNTFSGDYGLQLGENAGSTGTYALSNTGSLIGFGTVSEILGLHGTGNFSQSGGTNNAANFILGYYAGSNGTYTLCGTGSLNAGFVEFVGYSGSGVFIQTGGTNTIDFPASFGLFIGHDAGSTGSYMLSGTGTLITSSTYLGESGTGIFTQTGGSFTSGMITVNSLSTFSQTGGTSVISGFSNAGVVSIGSGGNMTVNGNYTQTAGSTVVEGLLSVSGQTTVSGGTLQIDSGFSSNISNNAAVSIQGGTSSVPVITGQISGTGTLTIGTAVQEASARVSAGSIVATSSAAGAAYLQLAPGSGTSTVGSLTINPGSTLDITNNPLIVNFTPGNDPAAMIRGYLQTGYAGGAWTGSGIVSSNAAANPGLYAVGYADGNTDVDTPAAANQILIENTLAGDANLDGIVNFSDLLVVAQDFGRTGQDWSQGDFNYDGIVNFSDLLLVAQNFGKQLTAGQLAQLPGSFAAEWQLAQAEVSASNVPEPTEVALLMIAGVGLLRRRRRRIMQPSR